MTCYHPMKGWRSREVGATGKRKVTFNPSQGYADLPVTVPCGQCIGCRLEKSRQWAIRCSHEASLHKQNSFITLTYNEANLPPSGSLNLRHFQLFMKRLRKRVHPDKIRFFHCGEYGSKLKRPHYHACLFGYDFPDKRIHTIRNEQPLYISKILEETWGMGFCTTGEVTFKSAAYVARYITKKVTGAQSVEYYTKTNFQTGEVTFLKPEYTSMSLKPGIGSTWFEEYSEDVFPGDFVVINGKKMRPPKFYDRRLEKMSEREYRDIRSKRIKAGKKRTDDTTPARLKVREKVQELKAERLIRPLENDDDT